MTAVITALIDGVVSEDLSGQCAALGLLVAPEAERGDENRGCLLLCGAANTDSVRRGLTAPFNGFIELGGEGLVGVGFRCFETVRAGGMSLSLLTRQAYGLNTLDLISEAVRRGMGPASGEAADMIDIGIGEALGNAVIHGNLGIPSHLRTTSKGFERFRSVMHERLADPVLSSRRVEINILARGPDFVTVSVSDQGHGYDLAGKLLKSVHSDAKCGRGLGLIQRICSSIHGEDDGRTLVMTFAR